MKKNILIIIFIFIISMSLSFFFDYSIAATDMDSIISQGKSFIKKGKEAKTRDTKDENGKKVEGKEIKTIDGELFKIGVGNIYNVLLIIGIAVSVIISGIMGIRIMIGSAEEKAQIKEQMIPYVIGCGVMFGAFAIWKIAMIIAGAVS